MMQNQENDSFYAFVLFLIWPFLAMVSAIRNYKSSWAKNVCWAFVAFFGLTLTVSSENQRADITRYIAEYQDMHRVQMTVGEAAEHVINHKDVDVVQTTITVVLSRITDIPSILTLVFGIVFGYFFSRNMWFVLTRLEGKIQGITIILFLCYFLVIPIWDLNGFRMWTAAHVFLYGLFIYFIEGKKYGLLIAIASAPVHFSFIAPITILFGYILLGNRTVIYFSFFIVTMLISDINLEVFNNFVEAYTPEVIQERTSGYRGEEFVERHRTGELSEGVSWYAVLYAKALKWSVSGFLILLFFRARDFMSDNLAFKSLYSFILLFYGFANILSTIPSGQRFLHIVNLFSLGLIIIYINKVEYDKMTRRFIWVATPLLLLFIIVSARIGLYSTSITTILGNPIYAIIVDGQHVSLNDVMRMILG